MGTENDGCSFILKFQDHIFQEIGIDRIQTAERFVQSNNLWLDKDGDKKVSLDEFKAAQKKPARKPDKKRPRRKPKKEE